MVEALEGREMLSVSVVPQASSTGGASAIIAESRGIARKVRHASRQTGSTATVTLPDITGTYTGSATIVATNSTTGQPVGTREPVTLVVATQSAVGQLSGTLTIGSRGTFSYSGLLTTAGSTPGNRRLSIDLALSGPGAGVAIGSVVNGMRVINGSFADVASTNVGILHLTKSPATTTTTTGGTGGTTSTAAARHVHRVFSGVKPILGS